jgi:hypothetical protein
MVAFDSKEKNFLAVHGKYCFHKHILQKEYNKIERLNEKKNKQLSLRAFVNRTNNSGIDDCRSMLHN